MEPLNRKQRRHPEKIEEELDRAEHPEHEEPPRVPADEMRGSDRVQDDLSTRAKNTGHKKKTADKWNQ
jgi:hypothetical protein